MTPSLTPPAYVSKGRDCSSHRAWPNWHECDHVFDVEVLPQTSTGNGHSVVAIDGRFGGIFRTHVLDVTQMPEEVMAMRGVVAGRAKLRTDCPVDLHHDRPFKDHRARRSRDAAQGALQRLTASQRSLLLALGEPDRQGLRHTHRASRVRQSGWLQSALALYRRGFVEKHREDGTHAIGDGAGRVWLMLTPTGEALRRRVAGEAA